MTAPIASGFPDFGRYQAQATKIYSLSSNGAMVAPQVVPLGYVGDVANLGVRILNLAGTVLVDLSFHSDAAYTSEIGDHSISFRAGDLFARTLPVLGPFCRVTFTPVTTPVNVEWKFYQASAGWSSFDNDSTANVLAFDNLSLYAPGLTNVECAVVWPGAATLFAALPPVAAWVAVYGVSTGGARTFLTRVFGNGIEGERRFFLPAQHIQVEVNNTSGVNQNFIYSLTADILR